MMTTNLHYPKVTTFNTINGVPLGVKIGKDYILSREEAEAMVVDLKEAISKINPAIKIQR
jgi:hypothetical protein